MFSMFGSTMFDCSIFYDQPKKMGRVAQPMRGTPSVPAIFADLFTTRRAPANTPSCLRMWKVREVAQVQPATAVRRPTTTTRTKTTTTTRPIKAQSPRKDEDAAPTEAAAA